MTSQGAPTFSDRQAAVERWRRRARIVALWRLILPAAIIAIFLSITGWVVARGLLAGPEPEEIAGASDTMKNPRVYGRDNHDRAYLLVALDAVRTPGDESRITLTNPTFNLGDGRVRADQGVYVEGSPLIALTGNVEMDDGDGGTMSTEEAQIDTRDGTVTNMRSSAQRRIQIENDMGRINADEYVIGENGQVTFRGRVRGVINPN